MEALVKRSSVSDRVKGRFHTRMRQPLSLSQCRNAGESQQQITFNRKKLQTRCNGHSFHGLLREERQPEERDRTVDMSNQTATDDMTLSFSLALITAL